MVENEQLSVKGTIEGVGREEKRKRIKYWLTGLLVLLILGGAALSFIRKPASSPVSFQTRQLEQGDIKIIVTATGNLEATNQVEVGSELSGIITTVAANYNDTVKQGQPLAYLDDTKFKAAVLKAKAEVASAEAGYEEAVVAKDADGSTLKRYLKTRELTNGRLPSLENLEQAEANLKKAIAAVSAARASVDIARASLISSETDLEKTVIYSPINGVVLSRDIEQGQTVAASYQAPVLFTLAEDLSHMELQVDVDEADVGKVTEGQQATFTVDAYPEQHFEAEITQVRYGAETNDGVVTYTTVLKVENPDLLLRPGMTATANIVVRRVEDKLLAPNSALRFSPTLPDTQAKESRSIMSSLMPGPPRNRAVKTNTKSLGDNHAQIWILDGDGMPKPMPVTRIASDGIMTAISSPDIHEGIQVITNEIARGK